jgi:hypothetical protein
VYFRRLAGFRDTDDRRLSARLREGVRRFVRPNDFMIFSCAAKSLMASTVKSPIMRTPSFSDIEFAMFKLPQQNGLFCNHRVIVPESDAVQTWHRKQTSSHSDHDTDNVERVISK